MRLAAQYALAERHALEHRADLRWRYVAAALLACASVARAEDPGRIAQLPTVTVVGTTPLPGLGTPLRDVPANVQVFNHRDLDRQRPLELTDFLSGNANSVNTGAAQGNPYQQDIAFRGLTASPSLGAPQGLSVFQDGVRINEAFGDVVNWDLLPPSAIASIELLPGSNPLFGLNTLGGALAIYTKRGADYPGGAAELGAGSFGRKSARFEYGGIHDRFDYFATGNVADDHGWAEHNPSRLRQFFAKAGYRDGPTDADVSVTLADNTLEGTQTLPQSWLDNRRQAYTFPDINENRLAFVAGRATRYLNDAMLLGGNIYYRKYRNSNTSSNVNNAYGGVLDGSMTAAFNEATNDNSVIDQQSWGAGLQLTHDRELAGFKHRLVVGASSDFGSTGFVQRSQTADFTPDRATVATGPYEQQTDVGSRNRYLGALISDTVAIGDHWSLSLGGRYNHARVVTSDRSGADPGLDGSHSFARFNAATGLNFNPTPLLTTYLSYNEGTRAPTPIELTCSDANAPCKLPNVFLADPSLKKVVAHTVELGARGHLGLETRWAAAVYRSDVDDDIQFIASGGGSGNAGYFQNVGGTRRQGIELSGSSRWGPVSLSLHYSHIDATFRSAFSAESANNSAADATGAIEVRPGARIPGIPANSAKLRLQYDSGARLMVGTTVAYASTQYAHGDENNRDVHGRIPAYAVANVDAQFRLASNFQLFANVTNLFNRAYENFALLGLNAFTGPGRTFGPGQGIDAMPEQFRGVGAPRAFWIGVRYDFSETRPTG